jgi:hypothetical protein
MKRVAVFHEDGRVLGTYSIDFANLDREPQDHWYFMQARENAIADELVKTHEVERLSFRFVDDLGEDRTRERATSSTEQTHLGRLAKNMAWAALLVALIAIVWAAISISLSSS